MSPSTLFSNQVLSAPVLENVEIEFQVKHNTIDDSSTLWQQVNDILRKSVGNVVSRQETMQRSKIQVKPHILVIPGMLLPSDEYEKRFGTIDLEDYRKKMSPELFRVFVRHIGAIPGLSKLNIEKFISSPEE